MRRSVLERSDRRTRARNSALVTATAVALMGGAFYASAAQAASITLRCDAGDHFCDVAVLGHKPHHSQTPSADPTGSPEPEPTAEPTAAPEPTLVPEPTPEPSIEPEPTLEPEPPFVPEPEPPVVPEPEPPVVPEPEPPVLPEPEPPVDPQPEPPVDPAPPLEPAPQPPMPIAPEPPTEPAPPDPPANPVPPMPIAPNPPVEPELPIVPELEQPVVPAPEVPALPEPPTAPELEIQQPAVPDPATPIAPAPPAVDPVPQPDPQGDLDGDIGAWGDQKDDADAQIIALPAEQTATDSAVAAAVGATAPMSVAGKVAAQQIASVVRPYAPMTSILGSQFGLAQPKGLATSATPADGAAHSGATGLDGDATGSATQGGTAAGTTNGVEASAALVATPYASVFDLALGVGIVSLTVLGVCATILIHRRGDRAL